MSYRNNLPKGLQAGFDEALKSLNIEAEDVFSDDIALIEARINNLLKTATKTPSVKDLERLLGMLVVVEDELQTVRDVTTEMTDDKVVLDEMIILQAVFAKAKTFLQSMSASQTTWDEIAILQDRKKRYIESQREHNKSKTGDKLTKADLDREKQRFYKAIAMSIPNKEDLNRIFNNLGVDIKQLGSGN